MVSEWDLQMIVPLWQGSGKPGIAEGADRLAELVAPATLRHVVNPALGTSDDGPHYGGAHVVKNHGAVQAHLAVASDLLQRIQPRSVLTLGGDCAVEVAPVSYLISRYPELRVVWIDAHADLNTPESSPSGYAHGMPLRTLFGHGHPSLVPTATVSPQRCALLGTRSMDPPEQEFIEAHDLPLLNPEQLHSEAHHLEDLLDRWLPQNSPLYVHLDLDVLDPRTWPAVAVPEPGGLDVPTLVAVINRLRSRGRFVGIGITEYLPSVDHDPSTLWPVLEALDVPVDEAIHPRRSGSN